jgi:hypothetical protein
MKITHDQATRLNALLNVARSYLDEIGGCDHSVNVCCCDLARDIEARTDRRQVRQRAVAGTRRRP